MVAIMLICLVTLGVYSCTAQDPRSFIYGTPTASIYGYQVQPGQYVNGNPAMTYGYGAQYPQLPYSSPYTSWAPQYSNSVYDQQNMNPCQSINCGPGRYCEPLDYGYGSGSSYKCRRHSTQGGLYQPTTYEKKVTRCFDELVYKVPAGSLSTDRNRMSQFGTSGCPNQCYKSSECSAGQICCNNGCGNICYTPETTVIDTANTADNAIFQRPFGGTDGNSLQMYQQGQFLPQLISSGRFRSADIPTSQTSNSTKP